MQSFVHSFRIEFLRISRDCALSAPLTMTHLKGKERWTFFFITQWGANAFSAKLSCLVLIQGFWRHVHEDHNMWNYLYFVLYLDTVFENDRNALENYVFEQVTLSSIHLSSPHDLMCVCKCCAYWQHDCMHRLSNCTSASFSWIYLPQVDSSKLNIAFFPLRKAKVLPKNGVQQEGKRNWSTNVWLLTLKNMP